MIPHDRYNVLLEFAHVHLDFHRPELYSILSMHGIVVGRDCTEISLPILPSSEDLSQRVRRRKEDDADAEGNTTIEEGEEREDKHYRPFLILSFSYPDLKTKFDWDVGTTNVNNEDNDRVADDLQQASRSLRRPTLISVLSRCTLIRTAVELWGTGTDFSPCVQSVESMSNHPSSLRLLQRRTDPVAKQTWKITVHTLGTKYTRDEQNGMRDPFSFLAFPGDVKMVEPRNEFLLIREIELDTNGSPKHPRHGYTGKIIEANDARPPLGVYFGRVLGGKRDWRGKGRLERYSLKKRSYLGPTSMDAELSLVMSNLAKVKRGSYCFDPFVGTGSILLTCGLRGGYCFGTDIDLRILKGYRRDIDNNKKGSTKAPPNPFDTFRQFGLPRPELVRSDNSIYPRHYRSHTPLFDAIVCDPPYGIRAGARKSGSKYAEPRPILEEHRHDHIAQTRPYCVSDVMADLLDVAARTLRKGGRLVYVVPSLRDFDEGTDLPRHECLEVRHVCFQPLQVELGRRVVVMEKVGEYNSKEVERYRLETWVNGAESAEKVANVRDRLVELAKGKPGYTEKAAMRKKKRKEGKEARKKAKKEEEEGDEKEREGTNTEK